ncbi:MAG TPA: hypothetical protein VE987_00640 [Polyangiaceae bacterium]|nr:hypothetical protein [Polyangiaceae bacterium]
MREVLGLPQVDLGRFEVRVPGALHDLERVVPSNGAPRDPGRTEVVERDGLAGCIAFEEIGPLDAGAPQVELEPVRERTRRRHAHDAPLAPGVDEQRLEQGQEGRLDRDAPGRLALGRLQTAPPALIGRSVNVDRTVLQVDVRPLERGELPGARVRVDREREEAPPAARHPIARDEGVELARPQVHLGLLGALVRPRHTVRRVVVANAQGDVLRAARVAKDGADDHPRVDSGLP